MSKPMSNLSFRLMSLGFKFRDYFSPPIQIILETELDHGMRVLDYGCGPGTFTIAAAELLVDTGKVFALDQHPLALKSVRRLARKKRLTKIITTIQSSCKTGLKDESIDLILFYDVLHSLNNPREVLLELYRVMKNNGTISFSDHHLEEEEIIEAMTIDGLFKLSKKGLKTYSFCKIKY